MTTNKISVLLCIQNIFVEVYDPANVFSKVQQLARFISPGYTIAIINHDGTTGWQYVVPYDKSELYPVIR